MCVLFAASTRIVIAGSSCGGRLCGVSKMERWRARRPRHWSRVEEGEGHSAINMGGTSGRTVNGGGQTQPCLLVPAQDSRKLARLVNPQRRRHCIVDFDR
ncbi:hypothetical protein GGTG_05440 [Gaeumannomyces tritici R3-111a-1]|uniref:Uncharacterized protein n=1 Tax=Gaeumannomyces tritici (strain R3-111a-1) TaxID=644352 RepID=J3NVX8_GAET3|nr:hypothetical protein GGTG_05440 [Gaeumannomyces tritici R3-111a-1]EJT75507.1 hypothetical protein GGTG_05440 [Gaeumannomyces tritici R3-111a-1]